MQHTANNKKRKAHLTQSALASQTHLLTYPAVHALCLRVELQTYRKKSGMKGMQAEKVDVLIAARAKMFLGTASPVEQHQDGHRDALAAGYSEGGR
jgi:hypothetical protein